MDYDTTEGNITAAMMSSGMNMTANTNNASDIADLETEIAKLAVTSDFYYQNAAEITFENFTGQVDPDASFCVPDGVYYEFYANLAATPDGISQVTKFQL